MRRYYHIWNKSCLALIVLVVSSCYPDEKIDVKQTKYDVDKTELDQYIEKNFRETFNMAIRYRYVDRYVATGKRVTPPRLEVVKPMLDVIQTFWIDPYLETTNGETFFRNHVPPEIILLGGYIYNANGTVTLGTADSGARITFTNVNSLDPEDLDWRELQLHTVYHEFSHIVHQRYKLPTAFETITKAGYTSSGSWYNLTDEEALQRGFVSPYATSSPNEDFAETVAFFLYDGNFDANFIDQEAGCTTASCEADNAGKLYIAQKIAAIKDHYKKVTGIDLEELRENIQAKL